jgi:hypothetical protein
MDEAVDQMQQERKIIFRAFAVGLAMNLLTVLSACLLLTEPPISYLAVGVVLFTSYFISSNAMRIVRKFDLGARDITRLDDLTHPRVGAGGGGGGGGGHDTYPETEIILGSKSGGGGPSRLRAGGASGGGKHTV